MPIRPARPEDAEAILAFWNPFIRDTTITFQPLEKTLPEVRQLILDKPKQGFAFLVAEDEAGAILGFVSYGQFRAGLGYRTAMEHTVILSPQAHGKGIARALMTALEDHARAQGYRIMVGAVSGENSAGLAFHKAIGYTEVGRLPQAGFKFDRYIDLVLVQKILS